MKRPAKEVSFHHQSVDHPWHVHMKPEGNDTFAEMGKRCKSLGPHYNPYHVYLSVSIECLSFLCFHYMLAKYGRRET